jgi:hypothetical protein
MSFPSFRTQGEGTSGNPAASGRGIKNLNKVIIPMSFPSFRMDPGFSLTGSFRIRR